MFNKWGAKLFNVHLSLKMFFYWTMFHNVKFEVKSFVLYVVLKQKLKLNFYKNKKKLLLVFYFQKFSNFTLKYYFWNKQTVCSSVLKWKPKKVKSKMNAFNEISKNMPQTMTCLDENYERPSDILVSLHAKILNEKNFEVLNC